MTILRGAMVLIIVAGIAQWASGCASTENGGGDGESHFLASCEKTCGGGFECVCGVCTKACIGDATCRALHADATCGAAGACLSGGGRVCDVPCEGSGECAAIGTGFACRSGSCRDAEFRQVGVPSRDGAVGDAEHPDVAVPRDVTVRDVVVVPLDVVVSRDVAVQRDVVVPWDVVASGCCVGATVEWRTEDAAADRHRVANCSAYVRTHGTDPLGCAGPLPACGAAGVTAFDVREALNNDGVRAAVQSAPATFGGAGERDIITIDGHELQIGRNPCGATPGCVDVPIVLRRLLDILRAVEGQQLGRGFENQEDRCRPDSACYLPPDPGVCTGNFTRYRYDPDTGTCVPFTYGGCQGNGNRFETIAACQSACDFDGCFLGNPSEVVTDSGACVGLVVGLVSNLCFSDVQMACACSCSRAGLDASRCQVNGNLVNCE